MVGGRRKGLDCVPASYVNALAPVDWRINNKKLEFEYGFDILIQLLDGLDVAGMMAVAAVALVPAKKGR